MPDPARANIDRTPAVVRQGIGRFPRIFQTGPVRVVPGTGPARAPKSGQGRTPQAHFIYALTLPFRVPWGCRWVPGRVSSTIKKIICIFIGKCPDKTRHMDGRCSSGRLAASGRYPHSFPGLTGTLRVPWGPCTGT